MGQPLPPEPLLQARLPSRLPSMDDSSAIPAEPPINCSKGDATATHTHMDNERDELNSELARLHWELQRAKTEASESRLGNAIDLYSQMLLAFTAEDATVGRVRDSDSSGGHASEGAPPQAQLLDSSPDNA